MRRSFVFTFLVILLILPVLFGIDIIPMMMPSFPEATDYLCSDGFENDGDNAIDCLDPDCDGFTGTGQYPDGTRCTWDNNVPVMTGVDLNTATASKNQDIKAIPLNAFDVEGDAHFGGLRLYCSFTSNASPDNNSFCGEAYTNCVGKGGLEEGQKTVHCRLFDSRDYSAEFTASYYATGNFRPTLSGIDLNATTVQIGDQVTVTANNVSDLDQEPLSLLCSNQPNPTIDSNNFCTSYDITAPYSNIGCTGTIPENQDNATVYCKLFDQTDYSEQATAFYQIPIEHDIYIEWIKPIQVVEDVPLVAGKATVVRVKVVNDGPHIETTVDLTVGNCPLNPQTVTIDAYSFKIVDFYPENNCIQ